MGSHALETQGVSAEFLFLETPLQHSAMVTSRQKPSASTKNQTQLLW